jgi:hypothetical protein
VSSQGITSFTGTMSGTVSGNSLTFTIAIPSVRFQGTNLQRQHFRIAQT